ncbi:MAG: DEAD/DEAH box helicase [Alphaproteobacteria bacterium]|nr:DEAD/DEAH box helicase [Alphaproteobacteria bacterium]
MSTAPNTAAVLDGLKDFQRATVGYVFERFYGVDPTRRFLVADEVGLGKTLVARGLIAKTIEHLWGRVPRIDVIYICSNADIARQNVRRLGIPGCKLAAQATRLTLLPTLVRDLKKNRVNLIALTPATSFEQTGGGGRIDERVLLYWLLDRAWQINGPVASLYVMQDYAGAATFRKAVEGFDRKSINEDIADRFVSSLEARIEEERAAGETDLRARFEKLCGIFCRVDSRPREGATKERTKWIGELRRLLARVCLSALEPDLIIMDEFQRFKHLLEEESDAGELARDLFESDAGQGARVLLLSATPYRSLSLHHEEEDNHYEDFLALLRFLEDGDASGYKKILEEYRAAIPAVATPEGFARLKDAKKALERKLRRVMARTERLASDPQRGGMLFESSARAALSQADIRAFLGAQSIADTIEQGDVVEYWKSAPYLLNFMDSYALKEAFKSAGDRHELIRLVREFPELFLDCESARNYRRLEPANPRLRELLADTVERGMWRLLWIPPTFDYYLPEGPFADPDLGHVTKRLVFSAWHMVPRAVSSLISYEAERRMMRAAHPRAALTQEDWRRQRGLLRFRTTGDRLAGMPLFLLVYPCLAFACSFDPRDLRQEPKLTASDVRRRFSERISRAIGDLGIDYEQTPNPDERWYWLAPLLLDAKAAPKLSGVWWRHPQVAAIWAGGDAGEDDAAWPRHVEQAVQTLNLVLSGQERLGSQPDDLVDVLALGASAAPATTALRALMRISPDGTEPTFRQMANAANIGRAFLALFNHAEVIEMVRTEFQGEPYWLRVLEYAHGGGLQAVLDEYIHLLRESLGVAAAPISEMADKIASELISAVTLRTASLRIDEITAPPYTREVKLAIEPMHIRFAMRFGDDRYGDEGPGDDSSVGSRKERVRSAFNSPFWPFVLVSTSVGQEGLDFHHYCHAVMHWNLPSNPVDLEQREGRIHRYKGHAVRKNLTTKHGAEAFASSARDAWEAVFALGCKSRTADQSDLVPYWLFPGSAKIERHVPLIPFSREVERLHELRRSLAIYRMVFGQSRQEDLITFLLAKLPEESHAQIVAELQMNLSPMASFEDIQHRN